MPDPVSLIKANPLLPAEDYVALRSQGIKDIVKLGSDIWTEYNNSDPGITILEAVCYAMTDLSYRTDFDMKDLLAPEQLSNDTWKQIFYTAKYILHNTPLNIDDYRKLIIDIDGVRNAWLAPSKDYEVPIWIDYNYFGKRMDYDCSCAKKEEKICFGKLGLNQVPVPDGTKNPNATDNRATQLTKIAADLKVLEPKVTAKLAQIEVLKQGADIAALEKAQAELADLKSEQTILMEEQDEATASKFIDPEIIELRGLYNVLVEYEEDIIDADKREQVRQVVIDRLAANRNLCEDFLSIDAVEYSDFGIGTSIVLEEYADPDQVLAQMFFIIYKYFTPSVPFYTIQQMLSKGYQVDEIFEGPALKHGFIDTVDLDNTALYRNIMLSDIISDISDITGIKAITYLHMPFDGISNSTTPNRYFFEWVHALAEARLIARIQPAMSEIMFCKEREFITYYTARTNDRAPDKMLKLFKDMKAVEGKYKLIGADVDLPVPNGECMALEDYYPITYSLPITYGVSDRAGLPADATDSRKAQALQLGGFLLFFEQILADYLVQLDHLRDLFSFDDTVNHTYFTKALTEIENLSALLVDKGNYGPTHFDQVLADFVKVIQGLVETPKIYTDRRNMFLNHLLARFSENLDEYEALMKWLDPDNAAQRLVTDKIAILKNGEYEFITSERGKACNYTDLNTWNTDNVSGAERRISRLLGFRNIQRKSLVPAYVQSEKSMDDSVNPPVQKVSGDVLLNVIKIVDTDNNNNVIFTSVDVMEKCCTEQLMEAILEHADDIRYFKFSEDLKQRSRRAAGLIGNFWFDLYDNTYTTDHGHLGHSILYKSKEERDAAFARLQEIMVLIDNNEGLHLVEHVLLRPKLDQVLDEKGAEEKVSLLNICLDGCDLSTAKDEKEKDPPYRKEISRTRAQLCYDGKPWVLQYIGTGTDTNIVTSQKSILFQKVHTDGTTPELLKFNQYENLIQRINDLCEFGSEKGNYTIDSDNGATHKYGIIIHGADRVVLAESLYIFNQNKNVTIAAADPNDVVNIIPAMMEYFGYQFDLYCNASPCDGNADPYSLKATAVLPCWPKRLRDPSFRNLVEKTIISESPAHVQIKVAWIGIEEMQRFEKAYGDWLIEMAQTEVPGYEKVNPLVDVLNTLVPCGECADDCSQGTANVNGY